MTRAMVLPLSLMRKMRRVAKRGVAKNLLMPMMMTTFQKTLKRKVLKLTMMKCLKLM